MTRVLAGTRSELDQRRVLVVRISNDVDGTPREAVVVVAEDGALRAYVNRCKHLPIPLDGGSRHFLDESGRHLMCGTHGALYRRIDGHCIEGPCRGRALDALAVHADASGAIWVEG